MPINKTTLCLYCSMIMKWNTRASSLQRNSKRSKKTSADFFYAKYVMTLELTSTLGVTWGNENTCLLSIGTKRNSSGPIVKNMGFPEKLYETVLLDYNFEYIPQWRCKYLIMIWCILVLNFNFKTVFLWSETSIP